MVDRQQQFQGGEEEQGYEWMTKPQVLTEYILHPILEPILKDREELTDHRTKNLC